MPVSRKHEAPLEMIRQRPEFVVELLENVLRLALPRFDLIEPGPTDLTNPIPKPATRSIRDEADASVAGSTSDERRQPRGRGNGSRSKRRDRQDGACPTEAFVDLVVVFTIAVDRLSAEELADRKKTWEGEFGGNFETEAIRGGRIRTLAVLVESQLSKANIKRATWPEYVTGLRKRLKCDVLLLVICPTDGVASWAKAPIRIAISRPPSLLYPEVIGPYEMPVILDPVKAKLFPEMTVLSALMHARGRGAFRHFSAFSTALTRFDADHQGLYCDVLRKGLGKRAKSKFDEFYQEADMEHPYLPRSESARIIMGLRSKGRAEGRVEGRVEGEARSLLRVLRARRLQIGSDLRARIDSCTDPDLLEIWVERAATATSTDEVFA